MNKMKHASHLVSPRNPEITQAAISLFDRAKGISPVCFGTRPFQVELGLMRKAGHLQYGVPFIVGTSVHNQG